MRGLLVIQPQRTYRLKQGVCPEPNFTGKEMENTIYEGTAHWAYGTDIIGMEASEGYTGRHFSSVPPLSKYQGKIFLTERAIRIDGDGGVMIPIADIKDLYMGFDDVFPAASVNSLGMFWKPLRIKYGPDTNIYLIVDYSLMISNNNRFYELLRKLLA